MSGQEPQDLDAEREVLGALLTSDAAPERVLVKAGLNKDDYYSGRHITIHGAIQTLYEAGKSVDEITVKNQLERDGLLEQAGGGNYLGQLAAQVKSPGSSQEHAELVLEKAHLRRVMTLGYGLVEQAQEGLLNGAVDDAIQTLERLQAGDRSNALPSVLAADVEPRRIEFLDKAGMIPKRSLTGVLGVAGLGKTTYTLGLAAQVTKGFLPGLDGPSNVVVSSQEDDLEAVLVPRLIAAGADLKRVRFVKKLRIPDGVPQLQNVAQRFGAELVVIDPVASHYSGKTDSHRVADVRLALEPLSEMAAKLNCAVLAVVHPNKKGGQSALDRISGAGFGDAARSVIVFGRDPGDPEGDRGIRRIIASEKLNVGVKPASIAAEIRAVEIEIEDGKQTVPTLHVTGESEVKAGELLSYQSPEEQSEREAAREWLEAALADGPRPASKLMAQAEKDGFAERTLRRAKADCKVKSERIDGEWLWTSTEGTDAN